MSFKGMARRGILEKGISEVILQDARKGAVAIQIM